MDKIKVLLFGMTGFGNSAFKVLRDSESVKLMGVFTPKKHDAVFPYYDCEPLQDAVKKNNVNLYEGLNLKEKKTWDIIKSLSPDLIIVSSFNQIMPRAIILLPRFGVVNVHPSLLPKYRGATPTVWTLLNGEKETGVTIHYIEDERIDSGSIITQSRLQIEPADTDGTLRFRLAVLSESTLTEALKLVLQNDKSKFLPQNESEATYYPKRTLKDAEINPDRPFNEILNKIRAMFPYPCAYLKYNGREYIVKSATLLTEISFEGIEGEELVGKTSEGMVKFQIVRENLIGI